MIRLFFGGLYTLLAFVFSLPAHVYFRYLQKNGQEMKSWTKANKYVRGFFKNILFIAGTKMEVRGKENIPKDEPALYVGNHRSYFDIITTHTIFDKPMAYVAKKEFKKFPFLHYYMEDIGCLFLDRENPREAIKTIGLGTEYLKRGMSLGLFPEGTRNRKTPDLLPFKEGGYRMAEKSDRPIVLMALTNVDGILENNKPIGLKSCKCVVSFSEPFYVSRMSKDERKRFYASIPDRITEMLKENEQPAK